MADQDEFASGGEKYCSVDTGRLGTRISGQVFEHYWEKVGAVAVEIQTGEIHVGDHIAFELPTNFEEQQVDSLQLENQTIQSAKAPSVVGLKTLLPEKRLKTGVRVYRVSE